MNYYCTSISAMPGFDPDDVTLVLMSHLHYDHSGGLVVERNGKLEPSFPAGRTRDAKRGMGVCYYRQIIIIS
jgi:metal-dependent hydrolase (beta-lactamase superfamily II)